MSEEEKKAIENIIILLNELKRHKEKVKDLPTDKAFDDKYIETFNIILNLIAKQNRMIELMAENLTTPTHDKEWVIKYFEGEVELEENA